MKKDFRKITSCKLPVLCVTRAINIMLIYTVAVVVLADAFIVIGNEIHHGKHTALIQSA